MTETITIDHKGQLRRFINFPHRLYKGDKNYVPELFIAQKDMLTKGKHPSLAHIELQLFLAKKDSKIVGRIAAIHNKNHNQFSGDNNGFFGFFDVIEDYETARQLLDIAKEWLIARGLSGMIGPVNYTTNDPCGLLIEGFDKPPQVMMTYNKPYYQKFFEDYGLKKQMDLFSYWFTRDKVPQRAMNLAGGIEKRLGRNGIKIRTVDLHKFKEEVKGIKRVYNEAWDQNWGFVPFTDEEFAYVAKDMKLIMDKKLALVAEKDNKLVGFILALPNINEIQIRVKKGKLFPTGILKLLLYKSKIKTVRIITLGVLKEYRKAGIEACLYSRAIEGALKKGITGAEASWILENNTLMNRELQNIGGEKYKTHRLFQLTFSSWTKEKKSS